MIISGLVISKTFFSKPNKEEPTPESQLTTSSTPEQLILSDVDAPEVKPLVMPTEDLSNEIELSSFTEIDDQDFIEVDDEENQLAIGIESENGYSDLRLENVYENETSGADYQTMNKLIAIGDTAEQSLILPGEENLSISVDYFELQKMRDQATELEKDLILNENDRLENQVSPEKLQRLEALKKNADKVEQYLILDE